MAEQPGTPQQRLQTSWHAAHQPSWSCSIALQRHLLGYDTGIESREQLGEVVRRRCAAEACTGAAVLHRWQSSRAQPSSASRPAGTQRTSRTGQTPSRCSGTSTHVRHTGIESREQLGQVAHVNAQPKPARLLACSTDGRAAGHGPAATPDQLVHSASVVQVI